MLFKGKQDDETRKVQFTGGSTFIISLPKRWIEQNQIKKGSFIKFREEESGLLTIIPSIIVVEKKIDGATIVLSQKDQSETIIRKIISAYLAGYNTIHIKTDKQSLSIKQRHEIKNFVRRMLVGTEIVTDTSAHLGLQVLLSYPELTIQNALRRMSIITISMYRDAILALKTGDKTLANEVILTDNEVDRFSLYITRLLRASTYNPRVVKESGLLKGTDSLGYRLITQFVERTADYAVNIADNALTVKKQLNHDLIQKIEQMSEISIKMFETSMEALFRQNYDSAEKVFEAIDEIRVLENEAIEILQSDLEQGGILRLIIESLRRTAEYSCDIAEIVLDLTIESILV